MGWTEEQQAAIAAQHQRVLVAAAAGSGKTAVLVARIIRMLREEVCNIDELLVLTFTRAAAAEMRERIEQGLQEAVAQADSERKRDHMQRQLILLSGAAITTIDSFCQRVLRMNIAELDIDPQFRAMDEQEANLLAEDVMDTFLEEQYAAAEPAFLQFADAYGDDHGDAAVRGLLQQTWHFAQSQPFPEEWLAAQPARYADTADLWQHIPREDIRQLLQRYGTEIQSLHDYAESLGSDGFTAVTAAARADWQRIEEAFQAGEDWDELQARVQAFRFGSMSSKAFRETLLDPATKKSLADGPFKKLKNTLKQLRETTFAQTAAAIRDDLAATHTAVAGLCRLTLAYGQLLQQTKREQRLIDFSDMEHFALDLLCNREVRQATGELTPTPAALALQEKYAAIVVDEYQDTNAVQEAICQLIARPEQPDVFLVGDVKQSIYRFRQADPDIFQKKYRDFPRQDGCQLITLRHNFRSRAGILDSANVLFAQLMQHEAMEIDYDAAAALYPKLDYPALPAGAAGLAGPLELVHILDDAEVEDAPSDGRPVPQGIEAEGCYIARRLKAYKEAGTLVYDKQEGSYRPMSWRDAVILVRAGQDKSQQLLGCLRAAGIPAYADANTGYFEAPEVRVMLALLTCLDNVRQDIPLAAVMGSPIGGFSMADLAKIRLAAPEKKQLDLYGALLYAYQQESGLSTRLADKAAAFCDRLSVWRQAARQLRVPELIHYLYQQTGYYNYVGGQEGGLLRQANLRLLSDRAAAYEKTNYRGLNRFLRFIDRMREQETDLAAARTLGAGEDVVRIMTIHKSKGLEFPLVFLADCGKQFNLQDANARLLCHKERGIALQIADRETGQCYKTLPWHTLAQAIRREGKAEELRVLYVALTRAREKLILTSSGKSKAWENRLQKLAPLAEAEGEALPGAKVLAAGSYLDWLLMALIRLPDGRPLREAAGLASTATLSLPRYPAAQFQVRTLAAAAVAPPVQAETGTETLLAQVRHGEPLPATEEAERVDRILDWHYTGPDLAQVAAKLSVSEIKRRFREPDEQLQDVTAKLLGEEKGESAGQPWQRPAFLQARKRTGAEYGTLMHTVMQHLDLQGDTSYRGLQGQLQSMVSREIILPEDVPAIYIKSLQAFCDSPLGEGVRQASRVWRELPFSRLLPARDFYRKLPEDSTAQCFVQGVIDLLYETAAGELVLVDYKTDRDTDPRHARDRHGEQIRLYREAVTAVTGRPVAAAYLFMLSSGTIVAL